MLQVQDRHRPIQYDAAVIVHLVLSRMVTGFRTKDLLQRLFLSICILKHQPERRISNSGRSNYFQIFSATELYSVILAAFLYFPPDEFKMLLYCISLEFTSEYSPHQADEYLLNTLTWFKNLSILTDKNIIFVIYLQK